MYRIAVCDDEKIFLDELILNVKHYLEENSLCFEVVGYQSGFDLIQDIDNKKLCDVYILDIEMPQYSGIELTKLIAKYNATSLIIFVTCHLNYAIDSFEYNIFRFIPKAELRERLPPALDAVFTRLNEKNKRFYRIENACRYEKIVYQEILYIYKKGKNSNFVLKNHEVKVRTTLKQVYKEINSADFNFCDRSTIVNLQAIRGLNLEEARIEFKNGKFIDVSKTKIQELAVKLHSYWETYV